MDNPGYYERNAPRPDGPPPPPYSAPPPRRRQNRGRGCCLLTALLLIAIVGGLFFYVFRNRNQADTAQQNPPGSLVQCATDDAKLTTLSFYYGSEKQTWINDVVPTFNKQNTGVCVNAYPLGSGASMQQILDGRIKPDIWSPAGNVWLPLLNEQWRKNHSSDLVSLGATDSPSLVNSPVVIAMWKPMAQALGWPQKEIGWADIAALSTNTQGWAAYGHPEFGTFKFGHTHPGYSNSGLDAIIAANYAATKKVRGLTEDDVKASATQSFVTNVERSIIHYGDSTGFFADKMFGKGPDYLSAAVMYENLVVEANSGTTYKNLAYPVVAIYPKEGTFYSDHPFSILQGDWVSAAKKTAALKFREFLLAQPQQSKALTYGFRPATNVSLSAPVDAAHGVDPTQPKTLLQVPPGRVVQEILSSWNQQRRKVDVMLVLDHSGSMSSDDKIGGAREGLKEFVNLLGNDDGLGLTIFSSDVSTLTPISPLGGKRDNVLNMINGIDASGGTRLYDTVGEQVKQLSGSPTKNIRAIVVLTDGEDTDSSRSVDQLVQEITPTGENAGESVKVFTIAYGGDANVAILKRIASATGGQEYTGSTANIREVYAQISTFF